MFFDAPRNGRKRHYIMYFARARVRECIKLTPQAHFCQKLPTFSMFSSRKTYVSALENVRFTAGKHTSPLTET